MGNGYAILLWDGWGCGLVRINPRLHSEGVDIYGNPSNWFGCGEVAPSEDEIRFTHKLPRAEYPYLQVIQ